MENQQQPIITIDIVFDRNQAREALRALLHAILFHRLFGIVKPQRFDVLDVTFPGVKDAQIELLVDENVEAFWTGIEKDPSKQAQITVTFSEKRQRRTWFSSGEEEVPWEKWVINAKVRQPRADEAAAFRDELSSTLSSALMTILTHSSSEQGRAAVPPITNASGISPFPLKISVKVGGVEVNV